MTHDKYTLDGPSVYAELERLIENVPADGILERMGHYRKRGRRGYSHQALWRAHLLGFLLNVNHTNDMIRRLDADPALRALCGFGDDLPHRTTFNRFNARLAASCRDIVESEITQLAIAISEKLPGFGQNLAIDSTTVYTHARSTTNPARSSDPEAHWSAKSVANPRPYAIGKEKDWHFGYTYHSVVDAASGIPIFGFTTPANHADTVTLPRLVADAVKIFGRPVAVMADKGYDSQANHDLITLYGAHPIIPMRKMRSRANVDSDLHTPDGILKCIGGVPMERIGYDPDKGWLYQCRSEGCDLKDRKGVRYCHDRIWDEAQPVSRKYPELPRSSPRWKKLYRMRQSVERLFKSLKESCRLNSHCSRGLTKVSLHAAMSVLAYQAKAWEWIKDGQEHLLRWMVKPIA